MSFTPCIAKFSIIYSNTGLLLIGIIGLGILGYNFDLKNKELNAKLNNLKNNRIYKIIALLNQIKIDYGIVFDSEDISNLFNKKGNSQFYSYIITYTF